MCVPTQSAYESDVALMAAAAAHDATAQRFLVERLAGRVRRLTGLMCSTGADADDAAQTALLEILRSADGFRVDVSLERWADRITTRVAYRAADRERRRRGLLQRWLRPGLLPWGKPAEVRDDERHGLQGLLTQLSIERREALVLRHALEYSVEEIAELTQAPCGTVKDRLVAARKQIRRMVERETRRLQRRGKHGR